MCYYTAVQAVWSNTNQLLYVNMGRYQMSFSRCGTQKHFRRTPNDQLTIAGPGWSDMLSLIQGLVFV